MAGLSFGVGQKTENKAGSDIFTGASFGAIKPIRIIQPKPFNLGMEEEWGEFADKF